jgi:ankyrin repeat protein
MEPRRTRRSTLAAVIATALIACSNAPTVVAQVAMQTTEPARAAIRVRDYPAAVERLNVLAERGDPQAQYLLASLYRAGLGVKVDQAKARALLLAAARSNHAGAAYGLAAMLANEEPRDPMQAHEWVKRAADAGHPLARAAMQRGSLPLQFLPQHDLSDAEARRAALWLAAQQDDADLVTALASREMLARTDDFGRGALAVAAQNGAGRAVDALLARGASPDQADAFGATPLMLATRSGNEAIVEALLRAHAPVNAVDRVGNSALMLGAYADSAPIVQQLIRAGADVRLLNAQGWSALDWAVEADAPAVSELLRQQGLSSRRQPQRIAGSPAIPLRRASIAAVDLYKGVPDLQVAAGRSAPALFQEVLKRERETGQKASIPAGAVFAASATGSSKTLEAVLVATGAAPTGSLDPLPWLATRGDVDALATLLAHRSGAAEGHTAPLLVAVAAHREQAVRVLLDAHADPEVRDAAGRTPLMLAAESGQADVAGQLLSHLARMDPADKQGRTALWYASASGSTEIVAALLTQKSTLDAADALGFTPLCIASARGHLTVVDSLLKAGANANVATENKSTPLMLAAQAGHADVLARLLAAGARIDGQNRYGDTALIVAVRAAQVDTVRELLAAGASDNLRNADRVSALDVANALTLPKITALLQPQ